jgi:hypothetical protein
MLIILIDGRRAPMSQIGTAAPVAGQAPEEEASTDRLAAQPVAKDRR